MRLSKHVQLNFIFYCSLISNLFLTIPVLVADERLFPVSIREVEKSDQMQIS